MSTVGSELLRESVAAAALAAAAPSGEDLRESHSGVPASGGFPGGPVGGKLFRTDLLPGQAQSHDPSNFSKTEGASVLLNRFQFY